MNHANKYSVQTHGKSIYEDLFAAGSASKSFADDIITASATDNIPMEDLIASYAEWKNSHGKALGILRGTSGLTSVISSSIFIWMILRSHKGLSTTQNRLLLGLCVFDIIFSLSMSTFNAMSPSDVNYRVWNARGNLATCTAQGFLMIFGSFGGMYYNAALNLYFLAVVKYDQSEEYIRKKIEPFFHGVPIVLVLSYSITILVKEQYNEVGCGICVSPVHYPSHCVGYEVGEIRDGFEIPCGRGIEGAMTEEIFRMVLVVIPLIIIISSLGIIYRSVKKQEKKMERYGVGALRTTDLQQSADTRFTSRTEQSSVRSRVSASLTAMVSSMKKSILPRTQSTLRSNNTRSNSRAVMNKAIAYSFGWFLSWGVYLIYLLIVMAGHATPLVIAYIIEIFIPLQGLFNLAIFMYPKVMSAKNKSKREKVSWCLALKRAFWSKGPGGKKKPPRPTNLRSRNHHSQRRNMNERSNIETSQDIGMSKKPRHHKSLEEEEEKTEIQMSEYVSSAQNMSHLSYASNLVPIAESELIIKDDRKTVVDDDKDMDDANVDEALSQAGPHETKNQTEVFETVDRVDDDKVKDHKNDSLKVEKEAFLVD